MILNGNNLTMTRGDSETISVLLHDPKDPDRKLGEGCKIVFTVRKHFYSPKVIYKEITEFTEEGKAVIELRPEDTSGLDFGDYVYDVQLTQPGGTVITVIKPSIFIVGPEVSYDG